MANLNFRGMAHAIRTRAWAEKAVRAEADAWNALYPRGTRVRVARDETWSDTVTASEAFVHGGQAVVWLEGLKGGWPLRRVHPVTDEVEA